jgi:SAM-dependent methyltransferase
MSAVFPTGMTPDSVYLYARMEQATRDALHAVSGDRVLDAAAGLAGDGRVLAESGVRTTAVEPSRSMTALAQQIEREKGLEALPQLSRVRAWSEALPFSSDRFDAVFCKGSLDHFDDPLQSIREMARVTRPDGRVVLAVVNMESLGCKLLRWRNRFTGRRVSIPGRRHTDCPGDHYVRYDATLLRVQSEAHVHVLEWTGVSLLWGINSWALLLHALPGPLERALLRAADALARRFPSLADVIVMSGVPA